MSDKQQAGSLLKMAGNDLTALEGMQSSIQFSDEIFGFHAQQVIEKCCKAWIALLGKKYPFTHDVSMLLKVLEENDCAVSEYWEFAEMTAFAMNIRYEGFRNFLPVIDKSKETCKNSGYAISDHFVDSNEMVDISSGVRREMHGGVPLRIESPTSDEVFNKYAKTFRV